MKTILLLFILLGCAIPETPTTQKKVINGNSVEVVTFDSCEYVLFTGYYKGGITHKGNCKNHRNRTSDE
jgi:hypothetical protein